jgi:hypothetical protein
MQGKAKRVLTPAKGEATPHWGGETAEKTEGNKGKKPKRR